MSFISANSTDHNVGGSQEHGSDVEVNCCFMIELASAANSIAACEHASPSPAMHVQCPVITSPSALVISHTFKNGRTHSANASQLTNTRSFYI